MLSGQNEERRMTETVIVATVSASSSHFILAHKKIKIIFNRHTKKKKKIPPPVSSSPLTATANLIIFGSELEISHNGANVNLAIAEEPPPCRRVTEPTEPPTSFLHPWSAFISLWLVIYDNKNLESHRDLWAGHWFCFRSELCRFFFFFSFCYHTNCRVGVAP